MKTAANNQPSSFLTLAHPMLPTQGPASNLKSLKLGFGRCALVLTTALSLFAGSPASFAGDGPNLFALRVAKAETVANGTIPYAVVLVEDGEITAIGQDLPIERGIPVYDLPNAVVTPGFVNCKSRLGLDGRRSTGLTPEVRTSLELYPGGGGYGQVIEYGVTTLGLYPAGGGVVGQAVAVRPVGGNAEEMVVQDPAYLLMYCGADKQTKKYMSDAFALVDDYMEKVEKEREQFEKKSAKKKPSKKKETEKDGEKDEGKQEDTDEDKDSEDKQDSKSGDEFEPPIPDERTLPMLRLMTGDMRALVGIRKAADYLHFLSVIEGRDFEWDLAIDLRNEMDLFYIADKLGERGVRMVVDPLITQHPGTRRERNLPAELLEAGVKLAFVPIADSVEGHESWRADVARLVRFGLPAQSALRALTLEPAQVLGMQDRIGSLEVGKRANLIVFDGDPFGATTKVSAVILDGNIVHGEL